MNLYEHLKDDKIMLTLSLISDKYFSTNQLQKTVTDAKATITELVKRKRKKNAYVHNKY